MPLTSTVLEAQLLAIQTAITTALANPAPNWSVGDVSFDQKDYLDMLFKQQAAVIEQLRAIPSEVITTSQDGVGVLGNDGTEYLGEDY